jgi:hypothetical protein
MIRGDTIKVFSFYMAAGGGTLTLWMKCSKSNIGIADFSRWLFY